MSHVFKRWSPQRLWVIVALLTVLLPAASLWGQQAIDCDADPNCFETFPYTRVGRHQGFVGTRGFVTDSNGNRVWVEHKPPTLVQLDEEQCKSFEAAYPCTLRVPGDNVEIENIQEPNAAFVLPVEEYNGYVDQWISLQARVDAGEVEVLTSEVFADRDFDDRNGDPLPAFVLQTRTKVVAVLTEAYREPNAPFIVYEFPIDPADASVLPTTFRTVLIAPGQDPIPREGLIAYKTDFIIATNGCTVGDLGPVSGHPTARGTSSIFGVDYTHVDSLLRFEQCDLRAIQYLPNPDNLPGTILGPVRGAYVTSSWAQPSMQPKCPEAGDDADCRDWPNADGVVTRENGFYTMTYPYGENWQGVDYVLVRVRGSQMDPQRIRFAGDIWERRITTAGATFQAQDGQYDLAAGSFDASSLGGIANYVSAQGVSGAGDGINNEADFMAQLALLNGVGWMDSAFIVDTQEPREINVGLTTVYFAATAQLSNTEFGFTAKSDIRFDDDTHQTTYEAVAPPAAPSDDALLTDLDGDGVPDAKRLESGDVKLEDQGLLKTITRTDLSNTDLYLFTVDGELVYERRGLWQNETDGLAETTPGVFEVASPNGPARFHPQTRLSGKWTGNELKVVLVNRVTGYVGTARASMAGGQSNEGLTNANQLGLYITPLPRHSPNPGETPYTDIIMRPPNLKVVVTRNWEVAAGLTAGEKREDVTVGFEGSTLTSDQVWVKTLWYDSDGAPLPEDLPGFTGRLARSDAGGTVLDQLEHFQITPNSKLQIVDLGNGGGSLQANSVPTHFYIHVSAKRSYDAQQMGEQNAEGVINIDANGDPILVNVPGAEQDFEDINLFEGPLQYRPKRYVPFLVPLFDETATRDAAKLKAADLLANAQPGDPAPVLEDLERIYKWVYRPEHQFSSFDLKIEDDTEIITEWDDETGGSGTDHEVEYELEESEDDPLDPLGDGQNLVFGFGYDEIRAVTGSDQTGEFENVGEGSGTPSEQLSDAEGAIEDMEAEDYLGLQLYDQDDPGNVLYENFGGTLAAAIAEPLVFTRRYQQAEFNAGIAAPPQYVDDYRVLDVTLLHEGVSIVSVNLLDENQAGIGQIREPRTYAPGRWQVIVDYEDLVNAGATVGPSARYFIDVVVTVETAAAGNDPNALDGVVQRIRYPVRMFEYRAGRTLGETVVHGVRIQDGSLRVTRTDFSLTGRGPTLDFTRSYSNLGTLKRNSALGTGWSHNWDKRLVGISRAGDGAVPQWVTSLKETLQRPATVDSAVAAEGPWETVAANGTTFRFSGGQWVPERGRHGSLVEITTQDDDACGTQTGSLPGCFVFTAKDGTQYAYERFAQELPQWSEEDPGSDAELDLHFGDGLIYGLGLTYEELTNSTGGADGGVGVGGAGGAVGTGGAGGAGGGVDVAALRQQRRIAARRNSQVGGALPSPLKRIRDRHGNKVKVSVGDDGAVTEVTDAVNRTCRFYYDPATAADAPEPCPFQFEAEWRLHKVSCLEDHPSDPEQRLDVYFCYDAAGYLENVQRAERKESYDYEDEPELIGAERVRNLVATEWGATADGHQRRYVFDYHEPGEVAHLETLYPGLRAQDVIKTLDYPGSGTAQPAATVHFGYGTAGGENTRTVSEMRGGGLETEYLLNDLGNPKEIREPRGRTTYLTWSTDLGEPDNLLRKKEFRRQAGGDLLEIEYQYDEFGNVEHEIGPAERQIDQTWTDFSLPETRDTWLGVSESWEWTDGKLEAYVDGDMKRAEFDNNRFGERVAMRPPRADSAPASYRITYDQFGGREEVTTRPGTAWQETRVYDARGRMVRVTDAEFQQDTIFRYDALDRLVKIEHPVLSTPAPGDVTAHVNRIEQFTYDLLGNRLTHTDRNGQVWQIEYTARDQMERITRVGVPGSGARTFTYDEGGRLKKASDWKGVDSERFYDDLGFLEKVVNRENDEAEFEPDLLGNVERMKDYGGTWTRTDYDELGRVTRREIEGCTNCYVRTEYALDQPQQKVCDYRDAGEYCTVMQYNYRNLIQSAYNDGTSIGQDYEYNDNGALIWVRDEEGRYTHYDYDNLDRRVSAKATGQSDDAGDPGLLTKYEHDLNGNVEKVTTFKNAATETGKIEQEIRYDEWNRPYLVIAPELTQVDGTTQPMAETRTFYDGLGNVVKVEDPLGKTRRWQRDRLGRVQTAYDGEGNPVSYEVYSPNNLVKQMTHRVDGQPVTTTFEYDNENRLEVRYEAVGTGAQREWRIDARDGMGNVLMETDYRGNTRQYEYNDRHLLERVYDREYPAAFTELTYTPNGRVKTMRDRRGTVVTNNYDIYDRLVTQSDPVRGDTVYTYYDSGRVRTMTDPRGSVTENSYDSYGRLDFSERYAAATPGTRVRVVDYEYDDTGNIKSVTDAKDNTTTYDYDSRNRLIRTTFPQTASFVSGDVNYEERTYYNSGAVHTVTPPYRTDKRTVTYEYDDAYRVTHMTAAAGSHSEKTSYTYDEAGHVLSVTTPEAQAGHKWEGQVQRNRYDVLGRLRHVTDPYGVMAKYEYDDASNLRFQCRVDGDTPSIPCLTNGQNVVEYQYDKEDRVRFHMQHKPSTSEVLTTEYRYEPAGTINYKQDPKGQVFTYGYDAVGRLDHAIFPLQSDIKYNETRRIDYTYDNVDNVDLVTETKRNSDAVEFTELTDYGYHPFFNWVTSVNQRGHNTTYDYDDNGNRTHVSTATAETNYHYDARDRLQCVYHGPGGGPGCGPDTTRYDYLPDSRIKKVTHKNGSIEDRDYYAIGRIQEIRHTTGTSSSLLGRYTYQFDKNGNRTREEAEQATEAMSPPPLTTKVTNYQYQSNGLLKQYDEQVGTDPITLTQYTYDGYNRQRELVTIEGIPHSDKTYSYDETHFLKEVRDTNSTGLLFRYDYDKNGNMLQRLDELGNTAVHFSYDSRNQLVQAARGPPVRTTGYTAPVQGDLTEILGQYDYNAAGLRIRHKYAPDREKEYIYDGSSVLEEHDLDDLGTNVTHFRYAYSLLERLEGGTTSTYHQDALGTTRAMTDPTGEFTTGYRMDPWGRVEGLGDHATDSNAYIFTGHEHDEKTDLIYMKARHYDPEIGRFIQQDSYLGDGGNPPSLHRYNYALGNPLRYTDPTGHNAEDGSLGVLPITGCPIGEDCESGDGETVADDEPFNPCVDGGTGCCADPSKCGPGAGGSSDADIGKKGGSGSGGGAGCPAGEDPQICEARKNNGAASGSGGYSNVGSPGKRSGGDNSKPRTPDEPEMTSETPDGNEAEDEPKTTLEYFVEANVGAGRAHQRALNDVVFFTPAATIAAATVASNPTLLYLAVKHDIVDLSQIDGWRMMLYLVLPGQAIIDNLRKEWSEAKTFGDKVEAVVYAFDSGLILAAETAGGGVEASVGATAGAARGAFMPALKQWAASIRRMFTKEGLRALRQSVGRSIGRWILRATWGTDDLVELGSVNMLGGPPLKFPKGSAWAGAKRVKGKLVIHDVGAFGEDIAQRTLRDRGYYDFTYIKNGSDNGIDIIARNKKGVYEFFEVKTTTIGKDAELTARQANMKAFVREILDNAASGRGRYRNVSARTRRTALKVLEELDENPDPVGHVITVDLSRRSHRIASNPW